MIAHMKRQGRSIPSVFQHSYRIFCNQNKYITHNTVTRPIQFSLGSLPTISSYTQKLGAGWKGINENKYFNTDELQKEVEMTTSEDYEKACIQLMTLRLIKVVQTNSNRRLFSIQCNTEPFEKENDTIQARHPKIFKNSTYRFCPHNELVMSMPFELGGTDDLQLLFFL
jgi:hypothetical protein